MSDVDPAKVKAAHAGHDSAGGCVLGSTTLADHDHCEPYRLADALLTERAKVARVKEFRDKCWLEVQRRNIRRMHGPHLDAQTIGEKLDTALADQPEQEASRV